MIDQQEDMIEIHGFPQGKDKMQVAEKFFNAYGELSRQLTFNQGVLFVTFYDSEYVSRKEFTFEEKQCFKKIAENKYTYQKIHNTWSEKESTLRQLNKTIEEISYRMSVGGRSLFNECICGGIEISFQQQCGNDYDCKYICQDCQRITIHGPGTNGLQIRKEGK